MAASDAKPIPLKNTAYRLTLPIWDADGDLVTGAAGLDSEVSIDGGTFADCTNEATEIATSSGIYYLDLTSSEMNGDTIAIIVKTSTAGAKTTPVILYPQEAGDLRVNVTYWNGTAVPSEHTAGYPIVTVKDGTGTGEIDTTSGGVLVAAYASGQTPLQPTVAGRTLDVSATGEAGIDWANIGSPTTAVNLSGTNIDVDQVVASVSGAVGSVTGNVGGNVAGSVGSVTAAVTAGTVSDKTGYSLSSAGVQAIWDALTSALTTAGSIGKLIVDNLNATISSRLAAAAYTAPPSAANNADAVWDAALAGHLGAGSTGAALNAAGSAGDPWATSLPGAYGAGTAGNIVGANLDAAISTRLASASYTAPLDAAGVRTAVGLAAANLDTQLDALPTATENADALLTRDWTAAGVAASRSALNALRFLRNKWALAGGTLTVMQEDDATPAWTAVVTTDATADPVTGSDPV